MLGIPVHQQNNAHAMRLATTMRRLGWERGTSGRVSINGLQVRGYFRAISAADAKNFEWENKKSAAQEREGTSRRKSSPFFRVDTLATLKAFPTEARHERRTMCV